MKLGEQSLRLLVEKWLAPSAATPVHVTRSNRKAPWQFSSSGTKTVRGACFRPQHRTPPCVLTSMCCDRSVESWPVRPLLPSTYRDLS
jgi:hypothetical protein